MAAPAHAAPIAASLAATNGEGSFDSTIACPAGDGPSWRYGYSGASTPGQGPFGGLFTSTFEVHDAGGGKAYIPAGTGRVKVAVGRGGDAHLELSGGDCLSAPLALSQHANGDSAVSGALPFQATGGSGVLRGLTGTGTASFSLQLGAGGDNIADIDLVADLAVREPKLAVGRASAFWANLGDYLFHRLTVIVPVRNPDDPAVAGDAFAVRMTQATLGGQPATGGIPVQLGRIDARGERLATLRFSHAWPAAALQLRTRVDATDALDGRLPALVHSQTIRAPLLP